MKLCDYIFDGPYDPSKGFNNQIAAVYAIIDGQPKVVDVGQSEDLNNRFPNHPRKECWARRKNGNINLYIYKESSEQRRLSIEKQIRNAYNPPCGEF
jgi:hypothetical protein